MSTVINLADARARGIELPDDNGVAQDILDEEEAWLAHRIGPLTGSRTETFYVGRMPLGKVSLSRYTDAVTLTDNAVAVDAGHIRLIDKGSAVIRSATALSRYWTGPYVAATYEPNDLLVVQKVLYSLVALAVTPASPYVSEHLGDYSYQLGQGAQGIEATRAALADSILPKRDTLVSIGSRRRLLPVDPVINRAEPEFGW